MPEILGTALEFELQLTQALDMELESPPALDLRMEPGGILIIPTEESPVSSVNGKTGNVELDAEDVGALPDSTVIPSAVSHLQNDLGFVTAETAPGKLNYIDTIDPLGGPYYRSNAAREGNALRLTYQNPNRNTYFYLFLSKPLEAGKRYTLSFDCSGVASGQSVSFRICHAAGDVYDEGTPESGPFQLANGRVSVTFTPAAGFQSMIRLDDAETAASRPSGTNIVLSNFQIEEGGATAYHPSMLAAHNAAERIETLTRAVAEKEGWDVSLMDEEFVTASIVLSKILAFSEDSASGLRVSSWRYYPLPFPLLSAPLVGSCDKLGAYVGNRNGSSAFHGKNANGTDRSVFVGVYYKIFAPGATADFTETIYTALQIAARRATPPAAPATGFEANAQIGAEIVAIAESYVSAVNGGREIAYGRNFLNSESSSAVNNADGKALMECDTYVGLVLRGIAYSASPYADTSANKTKSYSDFMTEVSAMTLPPWATALIAKITATATAQNYFKHDFKTAAELAWMFWKISGCLFSDPENAAPGDVAFFRDPQTSPWFDGIDHVAIVGNPDAAGDMTIYEVTESEGESGGKHLQHVPLRNRSAKPAYFARPYGWS